MQNQTGHTRLKCHALRHVLVPGFAAIAPKKNPRASKFEITNKNHETKIISNF